MLLHPPILHHVAGPCNRLSRLEDLSPVYTLESRNGEFVSASWDRTGTGYRLPTEAEWEYAARAGSPRAYGQAKSEEEICNTANVSNPATKQRHYSWLYWKTFPCDDGEREMAEIAKYPPNPWGLFDVLGNAREWVYDGYAPYPESVMADDPFGPEDAESRVHRGGSWSDRPKYVRVGQRATGQASWREIHLGLRIARSPAPPP